MTQDVSGFGTKVILIASNTYPASIVITQFASDTDPLEIAGVRIGDTQMGVNGDLQAWAKAVPLPMVLAVIPGSQDDTNLQILADANRVGAGKSSALDIITATVVYPDSSTTVLTGGKIVEAPFGKSIAGEGRLKTRSYAFSFENKVGS